MRAIIALALILLMAQAESSFAIERVREASPMDGALKLGVITSILTAKNPVDCIFAATAAKYICLDEGGAVEECDQVRDQALRQCLMGLMGISD